MSEHVNYVRNPDVLLREEDTTGGLLFNPDTNQLRVVNATGLMIWSLCDGKHEVSSIVKALYEEFDAVPEDEVTEHVTRFLEQMQAVQFLGV